MDSIRMEREGVEKTGGCGSNVRRSRNGARAEKQKKLRKVGARRGRRKIQKPHSQTRVWGTRKEEKYKMVRCFALCIGMLLFSTAAHAQLEELAKRAGLGNARGLSDSKVASGLKEALRVGANNAVKLTGKTDAYFGNAAIKILMPSNLRPLERGLRAIGFGPKVDEFILSMNRSAEAAAPAAKKILGDAILAMTFDDARKILSGGRYGGHRILQEQDLRAT